MNREHFSNEFSTTIQIQTKPVFIVILCLPIISIEIVAHAMTEQLS